MTLFSFALGASEVNAECHQDDRVMKESVKYLKSDLQDVQQRLTQVEAEKQSSAIPQISCGNNMTK